MSECDHVYRHLETNKHTEYEGWHHLWVKVDRFYCEKCLEIKVKKQEVYSREKPDWY